MRSGPFLNSAASCSSRSETDVQNRPNPLTGTHLSFNAPLSQRQFISPFQRSSHRVPAAIVAGHAPVQDPYVELLPHLESHAPVAQRSAFVSIFMRHLEGEFASHYNRHKRRHGAFWSERYHSTLIEDGPHLWKCMRYIDLNMVRAGVVCHPIDRP